MNLPPISRPLTSAELRDRVLASMNGESVELSKADRDRRKKLLEALQRDAS